MGFTMDAGISAVTVFIQGLLSFLSPCVLPLVPLYVSYLAGGAKKVEEDGTIRYPRGKVMVNTLFFTGGISFAFFLLGFGFTALGSFFTDRRDLFSGISSVIMILFGLYQLGLFRHPAGLEQEHRVNLRLDRLGMNPLTALLLGFTFSFAWTPCVGPVLTSVLLMASSAESAAAGFGLIGVYTLGFVIPFLAVGLFTGSVLDFLRRKRKVVRYTVKIGALLLILMGILTITGGMSSLSARLSGWQATEPSGQEEVPRQAAEPSGQEEAPSQAAEPSGQEETAGEAETNKVPAPDFTLIDQYGQSHTLSEYRGKTVFLNFWATWCPPCRTELPDIQALYEDYGENAEELVVLGAASPESEENPYSQDVSSDEIALFLEENGCTYPVVMDMTGEMFSAYGISAFPTTFMIDRDGNVFGYVTGALSREMMESIVSQTMSGIHTN